MVTVELSDGRVLECEPGTVKDLLRRLHIADTAALVVRDDMLLTPDIYLKKGDAVRVIAVVSGG